MLLGAFYAGAAIEHSMLGAAHACANPLTIRHNTEHGVAVAHMLAHVVRWNGNECSAEYAALGEVAGLDPNVEGAAEALACRLEALAATAGLSTRLRDVGVPRAELPALAEDAAKQWTGKFNPRPFDAEGAMGDIRVRLLIAVVLSATVVASPTPQDTAAGADSWPHFRGSRHLTGVSTSEVSTELSLAWEFDAGEMIDSSAAIVDGTVYVGSQGR